MTRQGTWANAKQAAGLCRQCGSPRDNEGVRCFPCLERHRAKQREKAGCKPWVPGGPGRPPIRKGGVQ